MRSITGFSRRFPALIAGLLFATATVWAVTAVSNTGPVFGLAVSPDDSQLVADAGAGVREIRNGAASLVAVLPGVSDVAPIGRGDMFAITGGGPGPTPRQLFRISNGNTRLIADLGAYEAAVNPDGGAIDSNPFDVAAVNGGTAIVADAAGNSLLIVDQRGNVDWIATLPNELVSTANIKQLFNCPAGPPNFCNLPAQIPAQGVATSVAIGPDGAYYVGELKGFPAPTGSSRVWRIEPGTRHAVCGTSSACSVVFSGFTSIVDLSFSPNYTLYVTEIDEASWFTVEALPAKQVGGTVNACSLGLGTCSTVATQLPVPIATAFDKRGQGYVLLNAVTPGAATISPLP